MHQLPPLDDQYLAERLLEVGPVEQGVMGAVGVSPHNLEAWCRGTGHMLSTWQFEAILAASAAYASELNADKKTAPEPWAESPKDADEVTKAMKAAFRGGR